MQTTAVSRKLAAILFVDIVDYSQQMNEDERAGLEIRRHLGLTVKGSAFNHSGRVVKDTGDGAMLEFSSAVGAVSCALEIRDQIALFNDASLQSRPLQVRMGIHVGDVTEEGDDIYGNAVNIAQRVQTMARPGGICITREVYAQIRPMLKVVCERVGSRPEKPLPEQVEVLRLLESGNLQRRGLRLGSHRVPRATVALTACAILGVVFMGTMFIRKSAAENRVRQQKAAGQANAERERLAKRLEKEQAAHERFMRELDIVVKLFTGGKLDAQENASMDAVNRPDYSKGSACETAFQMIAALPAPEQSALLANKYLLWQYRDLSPSWQRRWSEFWLRAQKDEGTTRAGIQGTVIPPGWGEPAKGPTFGAISTPQPVKVRSLSDARVGFVVLRGVANPSEELWCWILFPTQRKCWLVIDSWNHRGADGYQQETPEYWQQWKIIEGSPDSKPLP